MAILHVAMLQLFLMWNVIGIIFCPSLKFTLGLYFFLFAFLYMTHCWNKDYLFIYFCIFIYIACIRYKKFAIKEKVRKSPKILHWSEQGGSLLVTVVHMTTNVVSLEKYFLKLYNFVPKVFTREEKSSIENFFENFVFRRILLNRYFQDHSAVVNFII